MKKTFPLLFAALASAQFSQAIDAAKPAPACCVVEKSAAAAAPCCAEMKPAGPLSARSIYQLDAKWTDDAGQPVTLAALRGRPVVLAMFFASCEYACPILVNEIQRLRAALPAEVRESPARAGEFRHRARYTGRT